MSTKTKNIVLTCLMGVLLLGVSLWCFLKPADEYSDSERRMLATFPKFNGETILNGNFVSDLETYTQDQFPLRDTFRSVKAIASTYLFCKSDNNDRFYRKGHLSKLEYPCNPDMQAHAAGRFAFLLERYMAQYNPNVYFAIVPDKNYYLGSSCLTMDYGALIDNMRSRTDAFAQYIDLTDCLSLDSYYRTDTHWRQEKLGDVIAKLGAALGVDLTDDYRQNKIDNPFYGVYYDQVALPFVDPDELIYLTSDLLDACTVTSYTTGSPLPSVMYNMQRAAGRDAYEMFLSGSEPLLVIENPNAETDRELILFRDSFGSSLAPLLAKGYAKITVVDIRYVNSLFLGGYVDFHENQDVLFLYSTILLNNSMGLT